MSEIKWLKIKTHMFDDERIKLIEKMPDADMILVIWIKLLIQAGKTNASGYIYLSENIPYSDEMLSTLFDRPIGTIRLALKTFADFGMIEIDDHNFIRVSNWEKHQNVEGMEKARQLSAKRSREYRQRKRRERLKQEKEGKTEHHVTVTSRHDTDIDRDIDKDKERDKYVMYEKRKKFSYEPSHMKLAELFLQEIRKNNEQFKAPNLERWANTFRLMMERDKREGKEIQEMVLWVQTHPFWYKNILSAEKLRKQYDRLRMEMKDEGGAGNEKHQTSYERDHTGYDFSRRKGL